MCENGCHIVTPVCVHHKEGVVMIDILDILTYMVNRLGLKCKRGDLVLKGGLALEDKLRIAAPDFLRYTHVGSVETYTEVFGDIESWLNSGTKQYMYFKNGSAGYDFVVTAGMEQMRIGIDLNVAPMHIISIDYTDTFNIPTYDIYTMLADKMAVMCNRVIFRRIKDLYDIYAILHLADISYAQLWQRVERKRPGVVSQRNYMLLPEHYDSLQHAFTQFKGIEQHHDFDSIISVVSYFMTKYMKGDVVIWDHNQLIWKSGE